MSISVFDLFKIGVGPSSSHTVGPMLAAAEFATHLETLGKAAEVKRIQSDLFGSLSATGVGHGTDNSVVIGLMGERPHSVDPDIILPAVATLQETNTLKFLNTYDIEFIWERDMNLLEENLPYHPNAMRLIAFGANDEVLYENTYYSIGGGFVIDESEATADAHVVPQVEVPYDFNNAVELLKMCQENNLRISELMMENEKVWRSEQDVRDGLMDIWAAMKECIANGLHKEGTLPGGLHVKRRAMSLHKSLIRSTKPNVISSTLGAMDWVNLYALAVNEENAGGGRMVTAPTNGAAGIIPAVLMYYMEFTPNPTEACVVDFLLAAAAIGSLCKKNASISGAEVGCQGEVGSACAMAAAGLSEVLGGTPQQVENAAEIGLEHNLGLTCDPVGGLVQVPCIERNAIAAMKAINATQMALRGDGDHFISLDKVIKTMRDTGMDMQDKYKETSRGGLAVNAIEC
ncbi:L-serine ammonia-lyase [Pontibacterium granulatum]|uniref:L-serine ammonia-lyase n=1 Tax=Pontibacterium granulatum TaxID=2036029 RepID=UPI00249BE437|nr:L-serine ammonia-lyase [Pontibacterium granulatum]MDI3326553.1 L-serine ammonia-lyase [Pontibacterium granulatum]